MDFFEKLANAPTRNGSSESISFLGKRAAAMYVGKESNSLTDAVREMVRQNPDLSKDQVSRVAQAANQETWKQLFHDGGENVEFEPADGSSVLEALSETPSAAQPVASDFFADPPKPSTPKTDFMDAFGVKDGDGELPALNPNGELHREQQKVASRHDFFQYARQRARAELRDESETFYNLVKQAHLKWEHGLLQIGRVIGNYVEDESFASLLIKQASDRLRSEGVQLDLIRERQLLDQPVVVDADHPIIASAVALEKMAAAAGRAEKGTKQTAQLKDQIEAELRRRFKESK